MTHRIILTNGQIMLIQEGNEEIHIATESSVCPGDVEMYICKIAGSGTTVWPNSGDAADCMLRDLQGNRDGED